MCIRKPSPHELEQARLLAARIAAQVAGNAPYWIDSEVFEPEAQLAVLRAAEGFQRRRNAHFTTVARTFVRRALVDEIRRQSPWPRSQQALRPKSGKVPGWLLPARSLDAPLVGALGWDDVLPAPDEWAATERRLLLESALVTLAERERAVVHRYYWLGMTEREIAEILRCTASRVNQLRHAALEKLRAVLAEAE